MFLAFLKSPLYDRIVRMTQYNKYSGSDTGSDTGSDSDSENVLDEENQYQMIRSDNSTNRYDFKESDYYIVSYESTDTNFERVCKDCINYTGVGVCLIVHGLLVYIMIYYYM